MEGPKGQGQEARSRSWPRNGKQEFLIHGHTHSTERRDGQAIHVGVDAWDYRPASFDEIVALMKEG